MPPSSDAKNRASQPRLSGMSAPIVPEHADHFVAIDGDRRHELILLYHLESCR